MSVGRSMGYALTVAVIGLLILIHEAGHLIGARITGIAIERFSTGFGPRLWGFKRGNTEYRVSLVPIGGYVMPAIQDNAQFSRYPLHSRIIFAVAGPVANLIAAIFIMAAIKLFSGEGAFASVIVLPVTETFRISMLILASIPELFSHSDKLSGVIGIVAAGGKNFAEDAGRLVSMSAILSINLAIFNLLPIPPLDGGKILFTLLERLFKPIQRIELPVAITGWVLLLGLMAYASILDIGQIILRTQA